MLAHRIPRYTYTREVALAPVVCRTCGGVDRLTADRLSAPSSCRACGQSRPAVL